MTSSRNNSTSSLTQLRSNSQRTHTRVTSKDVQAAHLRRWDGVARITTDWVNLFHEPELCFPDGDLLIYLREPGQSSRPPAFRVHKSCLKEKSFDFLLDRCISRNSLLSGTQCLLSSCHGCDIHPPPSELYIPAPADADLDEIFDHHITTRNFFAWAYNLPLAGRTLGRSLVTLKERIDYYRPGDEVQSSLDLVSYAESQGYLDFRECIDHALAALLVAECLHIEDLWVDAFVHCVGMSHRGLSNSLEYWAISYETRLLIGSAQQQMNARTESVRQSVRDFFEYDLSSHVLGLSQASRDHFDRFRSWLHSYHIDQHGFWPPDGFEEKAGEKEVYSSMYFEFRNLYHHLLDPDSCTGMGDLHTSASGGVCVAQTIKALDARHGYESLPNTMPMLPSEPDSDTKRPTLQRRKSWNPITWRKLDKDKKKALRVQALINASNRDWMVMECPLVRRYSEFESQTIIDEDETISMIEGRKIRWILIYAILQSLVSVMQTPHQVRNSEGLTYLLCCHPPSQMPWQAETVPQQITATDTKQSLIEPDTEYVSSNSSSNDLTTGKSISSLKQLKDRRRQSLPARALTINTRPSTSRSISIKKLMGRAESAHGDSLVMPKSPAFCEILVQGYGNGLNQVDFGLPETNINNTLDTSRVDAAVEEAPRGRRPLSTIITTTQSSGSSTYSTADPSSASTDKFPDLTPTSSASVSRESSSASSHSTWSKTGSKHHNTNQVIPAPPIPIRVPRPLYDHSELVADEASLKKPEDRPVSAAFNHILDEEGFLQTVHFNTQTWDDFLQVVN